jgi:2-iminoacetate synthase
MSFLDTVRSYESFDFDAFLESRTDADISRALAKEQPGPLDFLALLSGRADAHLEAMAQRARKLTIQYFGRTIQLYSPLYLSNFCNSECLYCGFSRQQRIARRKLSLAEIEIEAGHIADTGIRHVLILTGEAPKVTPMEYLIEAVELLKSHFASISIEIFPMDTPDYARLKEAGVDGLTLYQEVYNRETYAQLHLAGQKADYGYRLDAPERGATAGFRSVNVGALLGLADPRKEAFLTGLHAAYLMDKFPDTEISLSMPRINPAEGGFQPEFLVPDPLFVRILCAFRLFLPRAGIPISTREPATFRDHLTHIGATRFSAGSRTDVGGYSEPEENHSPQFEISDHRSVPQVAAAIRAGGFQPVYKDWEIF